MPLVEPYVAKQADGPGGMVDVIAFQQAFDSCFALREGAHNQRPVGNRLIPRGTGASLQWSGKTRRETHGCNSCFEA